MSPERPAIHASAAVGFERAADANVNESHNATVYGHEDLARFVNQLGQPALSIGGAARVAELHHEARQSCGVVARCRAHRHLANFMRSNCR